MDRRVPPVPVGLRGLRLRRIRDLDDLLLEGVLDQLRLVVNVELAHQVELMCLDGLHDSTAYSRTRLASKGKLIGPS